ncbi:hypothetical protein JQ607_07245 [Bradyrhizobium liaoningense]|uniref:hypothetical protein n=1 Tax=Bradyrhizobium liaoningense TaxID=43992 RepID=UPI001BA865A1|nr:hypothetical protein [Bradyrhizobium liaoningense]MBR0839987.1 hypothetical protein [Bradyrhizobium liaoningense]
MIDQICKLMMSPGDVANAPRNLDPVLRAASTLSKQHVDFVVVGNERARRAASAAMPTR